MKSTYFAITCAAFSVFYVGLHVSFMAGALFEKKNTVCVQPFELTRIQESTKFFNDIYRLQEKEVKDLREEVIDLRKKLGKGSSELSSCYNKNFELKTSVPENKFNKKGKQIE